LYHRVTSQIISPQFLMVHINVRFVPFLFWMQVISFDWISVSQILYLFSVIMPLSRLMEAVL